ncbi:zinc dependent phospholipase C [Clostridium tepidiprofundi DSM 19306]|uniref:Phospholipase C n=1 Tax=Clostridium tepidiprofundi DSM 19306 TaxID=1121338 RepID=A0A151B529_9CLOT|nr:zinc dependent phospholipase C family protein [Clostridium tepidiprofundi]KYH35015.1 zinc dependent phospholipase C [Clostridium tepidiprofundi DSM 19306]
MIRKIEKTYGITLKGALKIINPIKKRLIKTYCLVHKFLNRQALRILHKENYLDEYKFYSKYIIFLNEGAVWADQDFKSINHFFHYNKRSGLFGFSNALSECCDYYNKAVDYYNQNNIEKSMFYIGAACHLVQDSTVPQHVNNKLLSEHRQFELWIIDEVINKNSFGELSNIVEYDDIKDYIIINSRKAYNIYRKNSHITDKYNRYNSVASEIIKLAQGSTAGFLIKFYNENVK